MTPEEVRTEIEALTADLISSGICIDQNYPALRRQGDIAEIDFGRGADLSITLKNVPYADAYSVLKADRSYNMRLIDGGLIQTLYTFKGGHLVKHRLAFFPSPDLLEYQNNSEIYELDEIYGDVIDRNVVTVPIRFDFDKDAAIDYDHPVSHLTIGQYRNCRIPVSGGIGPFYFVNFILRSFYNTPFRKLCAELREGRHGFEDTITDRERRHLHVRVCEIG
ncbi:MAG TPA: DUF2290 domain-containing protein [Aliidongia sp.]|nr:DUF2290 domain-containing protein [Aliidongia sp.]